MASLLRPRRRTVVIYAVALLSLLVDWYLVRTGDRELQTVLDHFPVTKVDMSFLYFLVYGPYRAIRFPPGLLDRFDWNLDLYDCAHKAPVFHWLVQSVGLGTPERQELRDPKTIFATAYALPRILASAERDFDRGRADRVLVLGGSDQPLSEILGFNASERIRTMRRVRRYFGTVFFEAKDVNIDGVRVMPRGLSEHYLRKSSVADILAAITSADVAAKPRTVLVAFDFYSFFTRQPDWWHYGVVRDYGMLAKVSRLHAFIYANSSLAQEAGVETRAFPATEWWSGLARYRFLLCPIGSGIVPPKLVEALLVLTVPIVQRVTLVAFDDLVSLGFPVVVLDSWAEVTAAALEEWWALLSPRLAAFRHECLTAEGYWRLFTGQVERCG